MPLRRFELILRNWYYQKIILDLKHGEKILGSDLSNLAKMMEGERKGEEEQEVEPEWETIPLCLDCKTEILPVVPGDVLLVGKPAVLSAVTLTCLGTGKRVFFYTNPVLNNSYFC